MKLIQLLTLTLICLDLPTTAAEKVPGPARQEKRFLFVVDISFSMARLSHASRDVLHELISTGLHHQMQPGDTFGIWTFNAEPHMDKYPLQVWDPQKNLELASASTKFLRQQYYEGRDRIDVLLRDLFLVIGDVQDVNILILSDGQTLMSGTPFDSAINRVYATNAATVRSAKKPFVTTLVARGGQIAYWSVTIGDQYFKLPGGPEKEPLAAVPSEVPTNTAPALSVVDVAMKNSATPTGPSALPPESAALRSPAPAPATSTPRAPVSAPSKSLAASPQPSSGSTAPTPASPTASTEVKTPRSALPPPAVAVAVPPATIATTNATVAKNLPQPSPTPPAAQPPRTPNPARPDLPATTTREPARPTSTPQEPVRSAAPPAAASASTTALSQATQAKVISAPSPAVSSPQPPPAPVWPDRLTIAAREPARPDPKPREPDPSAATVSAASALPERSESHRTLLIMGAALLAVAAGLGVWAFSRFRSPPAPSLISRSIEGR